MRKTNSVIVRGTNRCAAAISHLFCCGHGSEASGGNDGAQGRPDIAFNDQASEEMAAARCFTRSASMPASNAEMAFGSRPPPARTREPAALLPRTQIARHRRFSECHRENKFTAMCGICRRRPSITEVVRLRMREKAPDGYVEVRIPYCGQCLERCRPDRIYHADPPSKQQGNTIQASWRPSLIRGSHNCRASWSTIQKINSRWRINCCCTSLNRRLLITSSSATTYLCPPGSRR